MTETLSELESQRAGILQTMLQLGDLRTGSITAIRGRCGKPNCHCHRPKDPGHGPNYRLTRKVRGKTVSESFSSSAALRKAQREVAEFHRFRQLCQQFVAVNEKICRLPLRGQPDGSAQEKKRLPRSSGRSRGK